MPRADESNRLDPVRVTPSPPVSSALVHVTRKLSTRALEDLSGLRHITILLDLY